MNDNCWLFFLCKFGLDLVLQGIAIFLHCKKNPMVFVEVSTNKPIFTRNNQPVCSVNNGEEIPKSVSQPDF